MIRLIKNEFIKVLAQTSYKVLLIIIAALMLIAPIATFGINNLTNKLDVMSSDTYREWASEYENSDEIIDRCNYEYYMAFAECYELYESNGISKESWVFDVYQNEYLDLLHLRSAYTMLNKYRHTKDFIVAFYDSSIGHYAFYMDETAPYYDIQLIKYDDKLDYPENIIYDESADTVTKAQIDAYLAELDLRIEALEKTIITADPTEYLSAELDSINQKLIADKAGLAELESEYSIHPSDGAKYNYEISKRTVEDDEFVVWMYEFMLEEHLTPDDWQYKVASMMFPDYVSYDGLNGIAIPDAADYQIEMSEQSESRYQNMKEIIKDSFENDNELKGLGKYQTKSQIVNHLGFIFGVITIFCIVLASQLVAQEYSTGTIRLLLIRPRSRSKIMTSKLLCMVLMVAGLMVVSTAVTVLMDTILFGVGDLAVPEYTVVGGNVICVPFILTVIKYFVLNFMTIIMFGTVSLLISTLIKRSPLAIVLSVIINSFAGTAQLLVFTLSDLRYYTNIDLSWLRFTVLPYLNLGSYTETIVDYYVSSVNWSNSYYAYYASFPVLLGFVIVLLHTALVGFLTYLAFNKKQIKN